MFNRRPLELEELGDRVVPSPVYTMFGFTLLHPVQMAVHHHALAGLGAGTFTSNSFPDVGVSYSFQGNAHLAKLGDVTVSGSAHSLGFILSGHATGTLTFTNDKGSVTVSLEGPLQNGFAPLPQHFQYKVTGSPGAYANLKDHGSLTLDLFGAATGPGQQQGAFALTIAGGHAAA